MTTTKKKTTTRKPKTTVAKTKVAKPLEELPKNPFVFEVLDLVSRQTTKAKKVQVLKKYEDASIISILIWNFDESIISVLPEGTVPYTGYDDQTTYSGTLSTKIDYEIRAMHEKGSFSIGVSDQEGHTTIRRESRHFYRFLKGGDDGLNAIRRETMFINILEGLHPLEAEILCLVKDKNLESKYKVSKDVVSAAYPDIVWGGIS